MGRVSNHPLDIDPNLFTDADADLGEVYCNDFSRRCREQGNFTWEGWDLDRSKEAALDAILRTVWSSGFLTGLYVGEGRGQP